MYQLRNLINRRNVISSPENDVNSCEEFFILVVKAYVLVAAMDIFGMSEIDDCPSQYIFPTDIDTLDHDVLKSAVSVIVDEYVHLSYPSHKPQNPDHVQEYTKDMLTMGLFYMEFQDAIREGDGLRVFRCWKFLMLFYRASGHTNYAMEALHLLCQYKYLLPERLAEQLICERFVNTQGSPGANIPSDLHMEHLNRMCKDALSNLGANKTPKAIERVGKALGPLHDFLQHFDKITEVHTGGSSHTTRSESLDLQKIVEELKKNNVCDFIPGRAHQSFPKYTCNPYKSLNKRKRKTWMRTKFNTFLHTSHMNRSA